MAGKKKKKKSEKKKEAKKTAKKKVSRDKKSKAKSKASTKKKQTKSKKSVKAGSKKTKKTKKTSGKVKKVVKKSAKKATKKKASKKATKKSAKKKAVKKTSKKKATTKKKTTKKKTIKKKTTKKKASKTTKKAKKKQAKKEKKKEVKKKERKGKKRKAVEEEEIVIIKLEAEPEEHEEGPREQKIVIDLPEKEGGPRPEPKPEEPVELVQEEAKEIPREAPQPGKPRCPDCGSTNLRWDYEKAELVCLDCGSIIEESMIDFGPEWRAFDSYQKTKRQRTGSPIKYTKPNKGLVTEIDRYNRDIRGSKLSPQAASQMGRLRKWHKRSSIASSIERNLTIAMGDLERISSYLGLPPNIREAAALLYRKAVEKGLIRGRLIESVVAAVVYMICRQYGIPRTLDEIAEVSGISKKEIGRTYRFLKKELYVDVPLTNPIYYVPRFASALGLSGKVQEKAKEILQDAVEKGLISGRGPTGVAAAAVYIASVMMGERRTQKEVAEVAGVTEVTIRNRYRELKRELNLDIQEED